LASKEALYYTRHSFRYSTPFFLFFLSHDTALPILNSTVIGAWNFPSYRGFPGDNNTNGAKFFDYGVTLFWGIAGVLTGRLDSPPLSCLYLTTSRLFANRIVKKKSVHWDTFRGEKGLNKSSVISIFFSSQSHVLCVDWDCTQYSPLSQLSSL